MGGIILILIVSFLVLLLMNAPVAVAIAVSSLLAILANGGDAAYTVAQRMANGVDSFPLLAIPFFVFSGYLMGRGGLARRLIDFAVLIVGRLPGGLGYVNTLTCMLFGSISGSAAAAVSSIGGFMIPEMNRKGYDRDFNVALTATAATTGLLIPPSNSMIVYSVSAGSVSIAAMFMAGILPGILVGVCIMIAAGIIAAKKGYGQTPSAEGELTTVIAPQKVITAIALVVAVLVAIVLTRKGVLDLSFTLGTTTISTGFVLLSSFLSCSVLCSLHSVVHSQLLMIDYHRRYSAGHLHGARVPAVSVAYAFVLCVLIYREIPLERSAGHLPANRYHHGVVDVADRIIQRDVVDHDRDQHPAVRLGAR